MNSAVPGKWNAFQKLAFRYFFAYCFLYIFPFPLQSIPLAAYIAIPWNWFATSYVSLMSLHCFHTLGDWRTWAHFDIIEKDSLDLEMSGTIYGANAMLSLRKSEHGKEFPLTKRGFTGLMKSPSIVDVTGQHT